MIRPLDNMVCSGTAIQTVVTHSNEFNNYNNKNNNKKQKQKLYFSTAIITHIVLQKVTKKNNLQESTIKIHKRRENVSKHLELNKKNGLHIDNIKEEQREQQ